MWRPLMIIRSFLADIDIEKKGGGVIKRTKEMLPNSKNIRPIIFCECC